MTTDESRLEAAALIELERRKREAPLYFYTPSRKIRPFHQSRSILRNLCGGNRTGKTESNVAEAGAYALGYRPWVLRELGLALPEKPWIRPANLPEEALCFNGAGIRVKIPNTGLMLTGLPLKQGVGEILSPKVHKYLAPYIDKEWYAHAGTPIKVRLKNGSEFFYGSDEQDRMAREGAAYDWISCDEPFKKSTYTAIRRGSIDNFAPLWASYTPIGPNANWMFRDLYTKADGKRIFAVTVSIYDNDYLSREAIEEFANDPAIAEAEKEARLYGRFQSLIDRIYPEFDPDIHVVTTFRPPRHWYHGMTVDPHSIKPWFISYFAVNEVGHIYFYDEWPKSDFTKIRRDPKSFDDYAEVLTRLDSDTDIALRNIDPNYGPRRDVLRGVPVESVVHEMERRGFSFNYRLNDDLEFGESRVHQLLRYNTAEPLTALNCPKIYFCESVPNLINSMSFYTARTRPGTDGEVDETKREEAFKDGADVVRYTAVSPACEAALAECAERLGRDPEPDDEPCGSYLDD